MSVQQAENNPLPEDEQPPILGSWRTLYLLVIILHFVLIGLFYWFTRTYA